MYKYKMFGNCFLYETQLNKNKKAINSQ